MCLVNRAIQDALSDGREAFEARGILVEARLEASLDVDTHGDTLYQSLYTLIRALPYRAAEGSIVRIATRDRAGGDIELAWERIVPGEGPEGDCLDARSLVRRGAHGDLMALALEGLEEFCRARTGHVEVTTAPAPAGGPEGGGPGTPRRILALIPTQRHSEERYLQELARHGGEDGP